MFSVNSDKAAAQMLVKKLTLVLLAACILGYVIEKKPSKENRLVKDKIEHNQTHGYLKTLKHLDGRTTFELALHSNAH